MRIAFSPCPNDTFVFHALVYGLIPGAPKFEVTYADIDVTNNLAAGSGYTHHLSSKDGSFGSGSVGNLNSKGVLKISYAALPWVLSEYALLPCGGALGKGCGPLVLTKSKRVGTSESETLTDITDLAQSASVETLTDIKDSAVLSGRRVAVPSERSTAYLLFRLWAAKNVPGGIGEVVIMPFQEIMPAVRDGLVDAGLVIHEARFTYPSYGLDLLTDLGSWWEADTNLPIPLGAIVAHRSLDLNAVTDWIRASVEYAWAHPGVSREYVLHHAQEMDPKVAQAHIDLYVNEFTANLGESGYEAVTALLSRASQEGLIPNVDLAALRWW